MSILPTGNVGIGTTSPSTRLEVNGGLKLTAGSGGTIVFPDGTAQSTAFSGASNPSGAVQTNAGGVALANLTLNNTFINSCTATVHSYQIATLAPSSNSTYDHLHLLATVGSWTNTSNAYIDATFANRNGFVYQYTLRGAPVGSGAKLVAYSNGVGGIDIYLVDTACATLDYTVLENVQETLYQNPVDVGASISGTLVFDSSSASYPPATYIDNARNLTASGNVKLSGVGASLTFPDSTVQSTAWNGILSGGDYAESVDVLGNRSDYEPGDLIVIDAAIEGHFVKSSEQYSTAVVGVYSTKPGLVGRRQKVSALNSRTEIPMAMVGIVPTKVSAEGGSINPGDLLVTSSLPGYAMKGTDRSRLTGAVLGKSLGHLASGIGLIEVAVAIQ